MTDAQDPLVQFVFRSCLSEGLGESGVKAVVSDWEEAHRSLQLTGMLIRFEATFVGIVEGPRATVIARLETMSSHSMLDGLVVLREAGIARRRFATWRFQELSTLDGDDMLRATGGLFAHRLSRELHKGS